MAPRLKSLPSKKPLAQARGFFIVVDHSGDVSPAVARVPARRLYYPEPPVLADSFAPRTGILDPHPRTLISRQSDFPMRPGLYFPVQRSPACSGTLSSSATRRRQDRPRPLPLFSGWIGTRRTQNREGHLLLRWCPHLSSDRTPWLRHRASLRLSIASGHTRVSRRGRISPPLLLAQAGAG